MKILIPVAGVIACMPKFASRSNPLYSGGKGLTTLSERRIAHIQLLIFKMVKIPKLTTLK